MQKIEDFDSECVLLDREDSRQTALVELYNELIAFLLELPAGLLNYLIAFSTDEQRGGATGAVGTRGPRPAACNLQQQLEVVAGTLTKPRYRIGFVGRFQVGKSTAINELLACKVVKDDGEGGACTSVVTVIEPTDNQGNFSFFAQYFTIEQLRRRFEYVAGQINGCPVSLLPDNQEHLHQAHQDLLEWANKLVVSSQDELNPGLYLAAMVQQAIEGCGKLGMQSDPERFSNSKDLYNRLAKLVAYRPGQGDGAQNGYFPLLVKEFVVSPFAPEFGKVYMIDLPGLGTFHATDTELTSEYVKSLQGMLMFVEGGQLQGGELKQLAGAFDSVHQVTRGRKWLVITRADKRAYKDWTDNFFQNLKAVANTLGISHDSVRFFSAYCDIGADTHVTRTLKDNKESLAKGLHLKFENGDLCLPEVSAEEFAPFESAFRSYTVDGGYEELQRVMNSHIAATVRQAVCEEAKTRLAEIIRLIERGIDAAAKGGLDEENQAIADAWATVFVAIPNELTPGKLDLAPIAGQLFADLWRQIEQSGTLNSVDLFRQAAHDRTKQNDHPWVMLHRTMTREMARIVRRAVPRMENQYVHLVQSVIEKVAKTKIQLIDDGTLRVPQGISPTVQLFNLFSENNLQENLEKDLEVLQGANVIQNEETREIYANVSAFDYRLIMQRKVEALCYTHLARMRRQMLKCCSEVQYELYRRADPRLQPSRLAPQERQTLRSRLGHLLQRLSQLTFTSN